METLNQVRNFLDNIPSINQGGCGVAAISIYRWMGKKGLLNGNEKFAYLYTGKSDYFYKENEKFFNGKGNRVTAPSHVVVDIDGYYFDSTMRSNLDFQYRYRISHRNISEEILIKSLNDKSWNTDFSRERVIPLIQRVLGIDLSDIKISL